MANKQFLFWSKIYFALGIILPITLRVVGNKFLSFYDILNWRFVFILLLYAVIALILGISLKLKNTDENMSVGSFEVWAIKKNTPNLLSNALIGISVAYFVVILILILTIIKYA